MKESSKPTNRRKFLKSSAFAGLTILTAPNVVKGTAANSRLRMACIGAGGRAGAGVGPALGEELVAVAEVDQNRASKNLDRIRKDAPDAKIYSDYRELFDKHSDLDAVWVGTPDHNHFAASIRALECGAGVYCEKPLAWSMGEARCLAEVAAEKKLATQMGNQGHSSEGIRLIVEYLRSGALGDVKTVHTHCSKGWGAGTFNEAKTPVGLNWDAWLGPAAKIPYQSGPHPGSWRKFLDYGTGTLGDMACHTIDGAVWGLRLHEADSFEVEAEVGTPTEHGHPLDAHVIWKFPARGELPPVTMTWRQRLDQIKPEKIADEPAMKLAKDGTLYVGNKGYMASDSHCGSVRLIPESFQTEVGKPPKMIDRVSGHHQNWLRAIKEPGSQLPSSHFGYSSRLTEIVLSGVVAWRTGGKLNYDMKTGKFTNSDAANALLWRKPRQGWEFGYPA
jgi:predicted dehydrogenase